MSEQEINSVSEFLDAIPDPPKEWFDLPAGSRELLKICYENVTNLEMDLDKDQFKPPLIISFHPKASLLNNNVHETYLAEKVAKKFGMIPLWIPYVYDTGYKTAADKIRLPTYVYFEGKFISLRASAKIRGNIMATEPRLSQNEVKSFFRDLEKHENLMVTKLRTQLNPFNFGHYVFDLKKQTSGLSKKMVRKKMDSYKKKWLDAIKGTKKLAESLANISVATLEEYDIHVGLMMIDDILSEAVEFVFSEVLETDHVKKNPALLENLFLAYDLETKDRAPIMYAGDHDFIAFDEYDVKAFNGKFEDLLSGLKNHTVLPTGHLIMTLFTAMGCPIVLGGAHTLEYYPDYFEKAHSLLHNTKFNSKMQLLSYGKMRFMDLRNIYDILSVVRILDKVGSRNYIREGHVEIPTDVVDHLNFLAGKDAVPREFSDVLKEIKQKYASKRKKGKGKGDGKPKKKKKKPTALEKEVKRNAQVEKIIETPPEQLLKDPKVLKKWIRGTKFDDMHPVRLEVMLENLRFDADMRLRKLEENIDYEQHFLGGSLDEEVVYDGLIARSKRYPALFEMVYYKSPPVDSLLRSGSLDEHESKWIWMVFNDEAIDVRAVEEYEEYSDIFERLIPKKFLAKF